MLTKINEYIGVIVFYLLLFTILLAMNYQSKVVDVSSANTQTINER